MANKLKKVDTGIYQRLDKDGKGLPQFQVKLRQDGVKQTSTFDTKEKAKAWLLERKYKLSIGEPLNFHDVKKTKLADIFDEYIRDGRLTDRKKQNIERLKIEIGNLALEEITTKYLGNYIHLKLSQTIPQQGDKKKEHPLYKGGKELVDGEWQPRKYSASTVRKYYYDIRTALEWHSKIHDYPFARIKTAFDNNPPPEAWEEPRDRRLEGNELERLINACDKMYENKQNLKDIIYFQLYSCMRIGETLKMRWKDIYADDPMTAYIHIPKSHQKSRKHKNITDRQVTMRPELYELITKNILPRKGEAKANDRVFPFWKDSATFYSRFKVVCDNAEVEDFSIHCMRHEGISQLFEMQIDGYAVFSDIEIMKIVGHLDMMTTARYAKLRPKNTNAKMWAIYEKEKQAKETVDA